MGAKKGSGFERKTCKKMSRWFTHGKRDDVFWRTSNSGGRATIRAKKGKATFGSSADMCALDPIGQPLIDLAIFEMKNGYSKGSPSKRAELLGFLDNLPNEKPPLIKQWIDKIKAESKQNNRKLWFIIFKRDRKKSIVCMSKNTFSYVNTRNPYKYIFPPFGTLCQLGMSPGNETLCFMRLDDFLKWCTPETILRKIPRRAKQIPWSDWYKLTGIKPPKPKRKLRRRK